MCDEVYKLVRVGMLTSETHDGRAVGSALNESGSCAPPIPITRSIPWELKSKLWEI